MLDKMYGTRGEVRGIHPLGTLNASTKCNTYPSRSFNLDQPALLTQLLNCHLTRYLFQAQRAQRLVSASITHVIPDFWKGKTTGQR